MRSTVKQVLSTVAAIAVTLAAGTAIGQQSGATKAGKIDVQSYPVRPIRLINPFPPGGGSDAVAHLVSQRLFARWDQSVIVDNRGGAGGAIGTDMGARATPDGYTCCSWRPRAPSSSIRY